MNGIKLNYEGNEKDTGARPSTFEEFVQLSERFFPNVQFDSAFYYDDEGDQVRIRTTRDLVEAYRLHDAWGRSELAIWLSGKMLSMSFMTTSQVMSVTEEGEKQQEVEMVESRLEKVPEVSSPVSEPPQLLDPPHEEVKAAPPQPPELDQKFARMRLDESIPEDRYLICYKCNGDGKTKKGKPCRLCTGQGVINVATHPKFQRITRMIREEIESTLARIRVPTVSIEVPREGEIHEGVTCDSCGQVPILGPRYKCSVCENFDFCTTCEATKGHQHPFIKIRAPGVKPARIVTVIEEERRVEEPEKKRKVVPEPLTCHIESSLAEGDGEWKLPGNPVKRVLRLTNPGRIWPSGCRLVTISGVLGETVSLPELGSGENYEAEVTVTAPSQSGAMESVWMSEDGEGNRFGDSYQVKFRVETQEEKTKRVAEKLRDYMGRDPVLAATVLTSCSGDIEKTVEELAQRLG